MDRRYSPGCTSGLRVPSALTKPFLKMTYIVKLPSTVTEPDSLPLSRTTFEGPSSS